jgi:transcription factor E
MSEMLVNLLKNLVEELAGSGSPMIVEILFGKSDVNEFLIAKKMSLTINQIRNILYKLSAEGLVSFVRKKDKRKGWYIYYWTLNTEKCLLKLEHTIHKKIEDLTRQLKSREQKRYYICKLCNVEVTEETALEKDFRCDECAGIFELSDSEKPIKEIKNKIEQKMRELKMIRNELSENKINETKKKERADKRGKSKKKKTAKKSSGKKAKAKKASKKKKKK